MKRFLKILCLTTAAWLAVICPVLSESELTSSKPLRQLSEIQRPTKSVAQLVPSSTLVPAPFSEIVQVTRVKANPTDKGALHPLHRRGNNPKRNRLLNRRR